MKPHLMAARTLAHLSLLLIACCAAPPPPDPPADPGPPAAAAEAVTHARAIIERYIAVTGVPALQIAVGLDGEIVWSEAFGTADLEAGRPATKDSRFRIASLSKLLTGTLTAKLATEGRLDIDRPLGEYVPDLPEKWNGITAEMLVHHTSGIPHYADEADARDTTYYPTTRAALAHFRDRPLAHAPGAGETYSSYAYTLLALAIEQATGHPFLEVMRSEILDPLAMASTGPDIRSSPPPGLTAFYSLGEDGSVQPAPDVDLSGKWAGSGYLSTAEDLVRFGMAHTKPGSLSKETIALVGQQQSLPDGSLTKEGFGWGPRTDWDDRGMLWGDGSTPGSRCGLLLYPGDGLVIAILTNLQGLALERGEFQTLARPFLAARGKPGALSAGAIARGRWTGEVKVGTATVGVDLVIGDGVSERGSLSFEGWRSPEIADTFSLGGTEWIVTVDRDGIIPLTLTPSGDLMKAAVPRWSWSFSLTRAGDGGGKEPAE